MIKFEQLYELLRDPSIPRILENDELDLFLEMDRQIKDVQVNNVACSGTFYKPTMPENTEWFKAKKKPIPPNSNHCIHRPFGEK